MSSQKADASPFSERNLPDDYLRIINEIEEKRNKSKGRY